jgi:hypothetical protein
MAPLPLGISLKSLRNSFLGVSSVPEILAGYIPEFPTGPGSDFRWWDRRRGRETAHRPRERMLDMVKRHQAQVLRGAGARARAAELIASSLPPRVQIVGCDC